MCLMLVVDDDDLVRETVAMILSGLSPNLSTK